MNAATDEMVASALRLCAKTEAVYGFVDLRSLDAEPAREAWAAFAEEKQVLLKLATAALSIRQGGVKALVWSKRHESEYLSRAETIVGVYRVWSHHAANGEWFWSRTDRDKNYLGFGPSDGSNDTEEAAKAACQADFNTRILSALSPAQEIADKPSAVSVGETQRPEIDTEHAALIRLADGERIVYSRDGELAWFQSGDRAFVAEDVMMDLHLSGAIETLNDGIDEDWHEWSQITDRGLAALKAAQEGK